MSDLSSKELNIMPKQEHGKAENSKVAKKTLRPTFELNLTQTEMAKELDLEARGVASLNILAKKLFLEHMEASK